MARLPISRAAATFGLVAIAALAFAGGGVRAADADLEAALARVAAVERLGAGQNAAVDSIAILNQAKPQDIPAMLRAMPRDNPLAANWIRGAIENAAAKADGETEPLPLDELEAFVKDVSNAPPARSLAFDLLVREKPALREGMLSGMTQDPSLELRRDALVLAIGRADAALAEEKRDEAIALYRKAIVDARDIDQIQMLAKKLRDLEQTVSLPDLFGFIMEWNVVGPFDNVDGKGFDVAFGPEISATKEGSGGKVDLDATYDGKYGKVAWRRVSTDDDYGKVDLAEAYEKEKGACVYAYVEFVSPVAREAELRLGSINANKAWFNGEPILSNEVYHAATSVDQYKAPVELKAGKNAILLKICQNEQTEAWAQDFDFQCRISDEYGTAILSEDRPARGEAASLDGPQPTLATR